MLKRTLAALVLAAIGLPAVYFGGLWFFILIAVFLALAAREFGLLYHPAGFRAPTPLLVAGVLIVVTTRAFFPAHAAAVLTLVVLAAMTWHLLAYEQGRAHAAVEFTISLAGVVYLGWIGACLLELRALPDGLWWFFLVLSAVWLADSFAYFIGVRFGRHPLCPRLSPKKTWEGYWGGVLFGTLGTIGLGLLMTRLGGPVIPWWQGLVLGAVLSALTTLGDLGESMLKRFAGVKDSGTLMPGHGGAFDRIDSWLWGAALGYWIITWFFL